LNGVPGGWLAILDEVHGRGEVNESQPAQFQDLVLDEHTLGLVRIDEIDKVRVEVEFLSSL